MVDRAKYLVVKLSPELNPTILEYTMPSHQQLSQEAINEINKLKEYTDTQLNWFTKLLISKELDVALRNFVATEPNDENAMAQAAEVYSKFFQSTRFLTNPLNWIGKLFLSGLKKFANSPRTKVEEESQNETTTRVSPPQNIETNQSLLHPSDPLTPATTFLTDKQLFILQYNLTSAQMRMKDIEEMGRDVIRDEQRSAWITLLESAPKYSRKTETLLDDQGQKESTNETIAPASPRQNIETTQSLLADRSTMLVKTSVRPRNSISRLPTTGQGMAFFPIQIMSYAAKEINKITERYFIDIMRADKAQRDLLSLFSAESETTSCIEETPNPNLIKL